MILFCPGLPVSGTEGVEYLAKYTMLLNAYLFPKNVCIGKLQRGTSFFFSSLRLKKEWQKHLHNTYGILANHLYSERQFSLHPIVNALLTNPVLT
jgi:hypothetical protein